MLFFVAGVNFSLEFLIERRYTDSWVTEFVDGFEVLTVLGTRMGTFFCKILELPIKVPKTV